MTNIENQHQLNTSTGGMLDDEAPSSLQTNSNFITSNFEGDSKNFLNYEF